MKVGLGKQLRTSSTGGLQASLSLFAPSEKEAGEPALISLYTLIQHCQAFSGDEYMLRKTVQINCIYEILIW